MEDLQAELTHLLNRHSAENPSNTPDFILAGYMLGCLDAWTEATVRRDEWRHRPVTDESYLIRLGYTHHRDGSWHLDG